MRKSPFFWVYIFFTLIALSTAFILFQKLNKVLEMDVFTAIVVLFSGMAVVLAYIWTRNRDFLNLAVSRRDEFIKNMHFQEIRSRIEHNDIELQTTIAMLNISDNPYDIGLLPKKFWSLHEKFDVYLEYLKGVSLLYEHNSIKREEMKGMWSYCFGRLRKANTFDSEQRGPKIEEMIRCVRDPNKQNTYEETPDAMGDRAHSKEITDPIIEEIWSKRKYKKLRSKLSDEEKEKKINPLERPIWYYINYPDYKFTPIIKTLKEIYLNLDVETEEKYLSLKKDGFPVRTEKAINARL